jgi:hypothetical protein
LSLAWAGTGRFLRTAFFRAFSVAMIELFFYEDSTTIGVY